MYWCRRTEKIWAKERQIWHHSHCWLPSWGPFGGRTNTSEILQACEGIRTAVNQQLKRELV